MSRSKATEVLMNELQCDRSVDERATVQSRTSRVHRQSVRQERRRQVDRQGAGTLQEFCQTNVRRTTLSSFLAGSLRTGCAKNMISSAEVAVDAVVAEAD